jgi:hypothetical protein
MKPEDKKQTIEQRVEYLEETSIANLRDFFAVSVLSGAISAAGVPASDDNDYCEFMAEFCYKMADAMMAEKYKKNIRH